MKSSVSVQEMLLFDIELGLEGWELGVRYSCPIRFDAPELKLITFLSHESDLVGWSTVIGTGAPMKVQEVPGEI